MKVFFFWLAFLSACVQSVGQNFPAFLGSPYMSSLTQTNNPATIVNAPKKWDLTLFALQYQGLTNAVVAGRRSFFKLPVKTFYKVSPGYTRREAYANFDIRLLNARIALNPKHSIGFGARIRGYGRGNSSAFFYSDTISHPASFFSTNADYELKADITANAWMEFFASYGTTLIDNGYNRVNAGLTVKYNRGLSAARAIVDDVRIINSNGSSEPDFVITGGRAVYAYAATHDALSDEDSPGQTLKKMFRNAKASAGIDLGAEYIIGAKELTRYDDDNSHFDYSWKIGISLLDLGWNTYAFSRNSMAFANLDPGITGDILNSKFMNIPDLAAMNDSLRTMVEYAASQQGEFRVFHPARLVLNADHNFNGEFGINGNLTINLSPAPGSARLYVAEKNLLTLTPRWERRKFGFYLPVQYNRQNQIWIGGAVRIGPLFMGLHNIPNALSSLKIPHNGGGFIGLILSSPENTSAAARYRGLDCPKL